jgi:hypothetical protein
VGLSAEIFAQDCLRWRDVAEVHLLSPPVRLSDRRVQIGKPLVGSCDVIIVSPDEDPEPHLGALARDGVVNVSTRDPAKLNAMLLQMRRLFPRSIKPWREHTPDTLNGVLASPSGAPKRLRNPPGGARRLTREYLPCLFVFGADEVPLVFGPVSPKKDTHPVPVGAAHG